MLSTTVAYGLKIVKSQLWIEEKVWVGCEKHPKTHLTQQFQFCPHCGRELWDEKEIEIDGYKEIEYTFYGYKVIHGLYDEKNEELVIAYREECVEEPEAFRKFDPTLKLNKDHDMVLGVFVERMEDAGLWDEKQMGWWLCNSE